MTEESTAEERKQHETAARFSERAAYHEAGHAVVAEELGAKVEGIDLWCPGMCSSSGHASHAPTSDEGAALAITVAGQVAERIKCPGWRRRFDWRTKGWGGNHVSDGDKVRGRRGTRAAIRRAEAILRERWPAVESVAAALLAGIRRQGLCYLNREQFLAAVAGLEIPVYLTEEEHASAAVRAVREVCGEAAEASAS